MPNDKKSLNVFAVLGLCRLKFLETNLKLSICLIIIKSVTAKNAGFKILLDDFSFFSGLFIFNGTKAAR